MYCNGKLLFIMKALVAIIISTYNMGCFDIFCLVCGNPCHEMLYQSDIKNIKTIIEVHKKKTGNSIFRKNTKHIYDAYIRNPNLLQDLKIFSKQTKWMNACVMLLTDNKIEHNCIETDCNGKFKNKNGDYIHLVSDFNTLGNGFQGYSGGVFIHSDCYKYVENKYKIKLKYNCLPLMDTDVKNKTYYKAIPFINYGEIEKYWSQDFKFIDLFLDGKHHLCNSPLQNGKNLLQINKILNQMKLSKKNMIRPSPPISATFYSKGNIKLGNNGKLWIINNLKWSEIKKDIFKINIVIDKNQFYKHAKTFFNKLSYISQYNDIGIFVEDMVETKTVFKLTIITTIDKKDTMKKYL